MTDNKSSVLCTRCRYRESSHASVPWMASRSLAFNMTHIVKLTGDKKEKKLYEICIKQACLCCFFYFILFIYTQDSLFVLLLISNRSISLHFLKEWIRHWSICFIETLSLVFAFTIFFHSHHFFSSLSSSLPLLFLQPLVNDYSVLGYSVAWPETSCIIPRSCFAEVCTW